MASSPGVAAGEEKPLNGAALLLPLRPVKPPPLPKPENAVGAEAPLRENPLKPLKEAPPSACNETRS